jgi:hypothetical protein
MRKWIEQKDNELFIIKHLLYICTADFNLYKAIFFKLITGLRVLNMINSASRHGKFLWQVKADTEWNETYPNKSRNEPVK